MSRVRVMLSAVAIVAASLGAGLPLASSGVASPALSSAEVHPAASHQALGLHIAGHHIVNSSGKTVRLIGFNNSGAEYACIEGWGIFDVDTPPNESVPVSDVVAMAKWKGANAVRVSLNEQCWLGIGGVQPQYGGVKYQTAIEGFVSELNAHGFAVILDLHNSAPGKESSLNQEPMPDLHSITFWKQVSTAFKSDTSVLFDLFNEPFPNNQSLSMASWLCWRDGGCSQTSQNGGATYTAVGMNQLIHAVRSTGAHNIVLAGGLNYASSLAHWLRYKPTDPDHELAASLHVYTFGGCNTLACYRRAPTRVARRVPLVIGEFGADLTVGYATVASSCPSKYSGATGFDSTLIKWANSHHASWLAWTWNPWPNYCFALVSNFAGHATTPYGVRVRRDLLTSRQSHRA